MCCGKKRATLAATTGTAQRLLGHDTTHFAFRYIGDTALTTVGMNTGKIYRFASKGAVQMVHSKDAVTMLEVPNLVQVND